MTLPGDECGASRDRGASTVLALALVMVICTAGSVLLTLGQLAVARQRAATAADLAVLAGAARTLWGAGEACAMAADIATRHEAVMDECRVDGLDLVIDVSVAAPPLVRALARAAGESAGRVRAKARAGPLDP